MSFGAKKLLANSGILAQDGAKPLFVIALVLITFVI